MDWNIACEFLKKLDDHHGRYDGKKKDENSTYGVTYERYIVALSWNARFNAKFKNEKPEVDEDWNSNEVLDDKKECTKQEIWDLK